MFGGLELLAAFAPAGVDIIKSWLKKEEPLAPVSVSDQVELNNSQAGIIRAKAEADNPAGEVSLWVANLRGAIRPAGALFLIMACIVIAMIESVKGEPVVNGSGNIQGMAGFALSWLYGERYIRYRGS